MICSTMMTTNGGIEITERFKVPSSRFQVQLPEAWNL
jgi:hypothetical protein